MNYIVRLLKTLFAACLIIFVASTILIRLGAGSGWYDALGICVTAVMTYRILVPALGHPQDTWRIFKQRRRKREGTRRLSGPIH